MHDQREHFSVVIDNCFEIRQTSIALRYLYNVLMVHLLRTVIIQLICFRHCQIRNDTQTKSDVVGLHEVCNLDNLMSIQGCLLCINCVNRSPVSVT